MPTAFEVIEKIIENVVYDKQDDDGDILGIDSDRAVQGVKNIPYP